MRALRIEETYAVAGGEADPALEDLLATLGGGDSGSSGGGDSGGGFWGAVGSAFGAVGDFFGFDGSFGYDGGGDLSFGGFFDAVGDFAGDAFNFAGDFLGFDGGFGYDGGVGDLSFENFGGAVGDFLVDAADLAVDVAQYVWNAPNTAIGLAYGLVGTALDWIHYGVASVLGIDATPASITFENGQIYFNNNPLMANGSAVTLGNVAIFDGMWNDPGPGGQPIWVHEYQHATQGNWLGPLYLPAWLLGAGIAILNGDDPFYTGNFMEAGPYSNPPQPFT